MRSCSGPGTRFSIGSLNLSYGVVLMIAVYAVLAYALRYTAWGRHLYAVGDDAEAARLAGIRVNRVLLSAYVVAGIAVAVAAWVSSAGSAAATPTAA